MAEIRPNHAPIAHKHKLNLMRPDWNRCSVAVPVEQRLRAVSYLFFFHYTLCFLNGDLVSVSCPETMRL